MSGAKAMKSANRFCPDSGFRVGLKHSTRF
jgi:hypothetical protein